ncbi:MAG: cell division protein FtsZ [Flavobacteriales bacterium]|nr:cell division protein FtsZ [Flavobacteriales bacterium]
MDKPKINFDMPKDQSSIIKVIGVGGGGSNAVNHMYKQGIKGVDFIVCNTDAQALDISPVPIKIQLGANLTEGRGAGSIPEVGKNAALENINEIMDYMAIHTKMVFITAGLGGGTGTGAAPIIAAAAKERGILTVGIVTIPFTFEGKKRRLQAEEGLQALRSNVDTLLVICNDRLREMYGNLTLATAFAQADDILTTAARGIAEIITVTGYINVDFEDVRTVMTDSGAAIMGSATAEGESRALKAIENAMASPLLNDNNIRGARYILLNITSGSDEVLMDEITEITDYIQEEAGSSADIIWGTGKDENLGNKICVTLIATGFKTNPDTGLTTDHQVQKVVRSLVDDHEAEQDDSPNANATPQTTGHTVPQAASQPKQNDEQVSIEFDLRVKQDQPRSENKPVDKSTPLPFENQERKSQERINKLKELSFKLRTPSGLSDLENEPAYKRRNVNLDDVPHSSESQVSRYTLSEPEEEGEEGKSTLKPNNPFLHDNVD